MMNGETRAESGDSEYIDLKVVDQDGSEVRFRAKMTTQFGKLKTANSERVGVGLDYLRFLFDGRRIDDTDSPALLHMESEDVIEVYRAQTGGRESARGHTASRMGQLFAPPVN